MMIQILFLTSLLSTLLLKANSQDDKIVQFHIPRASMICEPGKREVRGDVYWICRNNRMILTGCIIPSTKKRIEIGDRATDNNYVWYCDQAYDGRVTINRVECRNINGDSVQGGEVFVKHNYAYTCMINWQNQVEIKRTGCAGDDGRVVGEESTVTVRGSLMTCTKQPDGTIQLVPVPIGQTFIEAKLKKA